MRIDRARRSTRIAALAMKWSVIVLVGLVLVLVLFRLVLPGQTAAAVEVAGPADAAPT